MYIFDFIKKSKPTLPQASQKGANYETKNFIHAVSVGWCGDTTVFAIDTENQKQEDLSNYSVRVNGKRKNHCTTIGLKEPESVTCPSCGTQTTDITRSYTLPDGFEEVACDSYQYGTDILYHYVDC